MSKVNHLLFSTFIIYSSVSYSFSSVNNQEFESVSSVEAGTGSADAGLLANLPYSACSEETTDGIVRLPLSDEQCEQVSLKLGSKNHRKLQYPPEKNVINYDKLVNVPNNKQVENIVNNYNIGRGIESISYTLPTVFQLQWMLDNELIPNVNGKNYWVTFKGQTRRAFNNKDDAHGHHQGTNEASIIRLATEITPSSSCTFMGGPYDDTRCDIKLKNPPIRRIHIQGDNLKNPYFELSFFVRGKPSSKVVYRRTARDNFWVEVPYDHAVTFKYAKWDATASGDTDTELVDIDKHFNHFDDEPWLCYYFQSAYMGVNLMGPFNHKNCSPNPFP